MMPAVTFFHVFFMAYITATDGAGLFASGQPMASWYVTMTGLALTTMTLLYMQGNPRNARRNRLCYALTNTLIFSCAVTALFAFTYRQHISAATPEAQREKYHPSVTMAMMMVFAGLETNLLGMPLRYKVMRITPLTVCALVARAVGITTYRPNLEDVCGYYAGTGLGYHIERIMLQMYGRSGRFVAQGSDAAPGRAQGSDPLAELARQWTGSTSTSQTDSAASSSGPSARSEGVPAPEPSHPAAAAADSGAAAPAPACAPLLLAAEAHRQQATAGATARAAAAEAVGPPAARRQAAMEEAAEASAARLNALILGSLPGASRAPPTRTEQEASFRAWIFARSARSHLLLSALLCLLLLLCAPAWHPLRYALLPLPLLRAALRRARTPQRAQQVWALAWLGATSGLSLATADFSGPLLGAIECRSPWLSWWRKGPAALSEGRRPSSLEARRGLRVSPAAALSMRAPPAFLAPGGWASTPRSRSSTCCASAPRSTWAAPRGTRGWPCCRSRARCSGPTSSWAYSRSGRSCTPSPRSSCAPSRASTTTTSCCSLRCRRRRPPPPRAAAARPPLGPCPAPPPPRRPHRRTARRICAPPRPPPPPPSRASGRPRCSMCPRACRA